ncbi:MAG: hypothetical protein RLZZ620_1212 [Pseudomonadota bacterium]
MLKRTYLPSDDRPIAVVIGSGFGGLAAAIRLSHKGYRVKVFEKLDKPGGRAYVHERDGYTFDAGPTIITAPFLLEELWELCGEKLETDVDLRLMDPFYRIRFDDGSHFDYTGDLKRMRDEVAKFSPADLPGYDRFLAEAEKCYQLGFKELSNVAFDSLSDLFEAFPSMVKMKAWESIYTLVARHLKNDKLRQVMSFHPLLIGGNPFSVTAVYSLINSLERKHGVFSAMGGTGSLIKGLVRLLADVGVDVQCNQEVKRIEVRDGKAVGITLADGNFVPADIVVSPRVKGNNTPMKIYSYLHSGKALLATDLATHRQVLDEEISVLAPAEATGFAAGLRTLLDNPRLRKTIGENAQRRAEALYTLSAFETQLAALYDEVRVRVSEGGPQDGVVQEEA